MIKANSAGFNGTKYSGGCLSESIGLEAGTLSKYYDLQFNEQVKAMYNGYHFGTQEIYNAGLKGETILLGIGHNLKQCQIVNETI